MQRIKNVLIVALLSVAILSTSLPVRASTSTDDARIPPATKIIDTTSNVWTLTDGVVYENGAKAGYSNGVIKLTYKGGTIYQENNQKLWWSWNGSTWISSGNPYLKVSSDNTSIPPATKIIDATSNVWTLNGGIVYENGAKAGYSNGVIELTYKGGTIYQENNQKLWWSWNGSTWISSGNPYLVLSPDNTSIPPATNIIDATSNVWTLNGGIVYENGTKAGYSNGVIELTYKGGTIYQENNQKLWWSWNGATWISSSAPGDTTAVDGTCGMSNGASLSAAPSTNLCTTGTSAPVTGSGPWLWSCAGSNGGMSASCSATLKPIAVNGACGTSNGASLSAAPSTNLCTTGTSAPVTGSGPWSWSCAGSNGGMSASCSATLKPIAVDGTCGTSNGASLSAAPSTNLCTTGTSAPVTGSGPWSWSCAGSNGGTSASCSATLKPIAVDGTCGTSNGASLSAAPSTNLCTTGTSAPVTGSGPWSWSCAGSNGGMSASCSATLKPIAVNGACGTSNGASLSAAPSTNLCTTGTSAPVTGSGPWSWSCAGSNGGTSASCSATLAVVFSPAPVGISNPSIAAGTSIPPASKIVDTSGAVWTLANGVVYVNGATAGYSSGVVNLVYLNGVIYQENAANAWYSWTGSGWINAYSPITGTDAVCGTLQNVCNIGTLSNSADNGTTTTWSCLGINGGATASCKFADPPINGTCGSVSMTCSKGTVANIADNGANTTWSCSGNTLGTTATCTAIDAQSNTANSKLGINLGFLTDWGDRELMFVDVMKIARGFATITVPYDPTNNPVPLDANGWPTTDFGVVFISNSSDPLNRPLTTTAPSMFGTYNLSFTGQATVAGFACCQVQNLIYNAATNTTTAQVVVGPTDTQVALLFTNTNKGVQNLKLLRPGYALGTTQVFTTQFLNAIAPFGTLRFMDPLVTNNSTVTSWAQRTLPTAPSQASAGTGLAWEYVILLANTAGKDIWINIPEGVNVSDTSANNYVLQLAQMLKAALNPNLHVYIEYSNELWNYSFMQTGQNLNDANADVSSGADLTLNYDNNGSQYYWASRRIVHQIVRISQIFKKVYGAAAINTTIRPVYTSQFVQPFITEDGLLYLSANFGAPNQYIYGIGGAGYFGPSGSSAYPDEPSNLASLQTGLIVTDSMFPTETYSGGIQYSNLSFKGIADYYGLKNVSYEGGPGLSPGSSAIINEETESDPGLSQMIETELARWYGCGNDLFMYFDLAEAPGNVWGAMEDVAVPMPKYNGLLSVAATPLSNFTQCSN